jgi:predicted peptidase
MPSRPPLLFLITAAVAVVAGSAARAAGDSAADWSKMKRLQPRGYVCCRADTAINVDGKLDEAAWERAPWSEPFADIEGDAKPAPTYCTRAKMLWDDRFLYIAARLDEPHVWATIREHDAVVFQDNDFELFFDPDGDNHSYYEFEMNAFNTGWDLYLPKPYKDDGKADNSWEIPGLRSAVNVDGTINDPSDIDHNWTVELAFPWTAFNRGGRDAIAPKAGDRWRMNFSRVEWQRTVADGKYRKVPNKPENNWIWSPQGIVDMHRPERWGYVEFSNASKADAPFRPDPALPARDLLMEIYHHQKSFRERHGRWAERLDDLAIDPKTLKRFPSPPEMHLTDDGFLATLRRTAEDGVREEWHVRQDSRLWMTRVEEKRPGIPAALDSAGKNRPQIERALRDAPADQKEGMLFLVENMPERDLQNLSAEFLLENTGYAYRAWLESSWRDRIPKDVFLNDVLPYASINERRDQWRRDFFERFSPLVKEARNPSQAAAILNQKIFGVLNVRYSTKRAKADQSPYESIESGLASCTGLAVLLVDACRAVGVPARFVGVPMWSDDSGNHSWVEVWDQGWHFTGAAEPNGDKLDSGWFGGRASTARRDDPLHAIYAVSFRRTPTRFPMVWSRKNRDVWAVNVTDRYTEHAPFVPEGSVSIMFRAVNGLNERVVARLKVRGSDGEQVFEGVTKDERFDANDHLTAVIKAGAKYEIEAQFETQTVRATVDSVPAGQLVTLVFVADRTEQADAAARHGADRETKIALVTASVRVDSDKSTAAVASLKEYLARDAATRGALQKQTFSEVPLTREDAAQAEQLLVADHTRRIRAEREGEMKEGKLRQGDLVMPFFLKVFGNKPQSGRSLFISMHGGGGAPKAVNDSQWENQKRLYTLAEGVYAVPRAPTDTWNLWHQDHIDSLFDRLIEDLIVFEDVDPDRVYIMGYSAGGDGVYQLAPRMADRLAAAAMMAGHPNEASPLGLRNLPFTIHVGGKDSAFNRNNVAREWEKKLDDLKKSDPDGYPHLVSVHPDKGHWMDRQDAVALPWMAKFSRNPLPAKIVWRQDDVTHNRFYWLAIDDDQRKAGTEVVATRDRQRVDLHSDQLDRVTVRFNDRMLDLDQPITIARDGKQMETASVQRTIGVLHKTLEERGDPKSVFSAEVVVRFPAETVH